jgi:hypothetical protein
MAPLPFPAVNLLRDRVGNSAGKWRVPAGHEFLGAFTLRVAHSLAANSYVAHVPHLPQSCKNDQRKDTKQHEKTFLFVLFGVLSWIVFSLMTGDLAFTSSATESFYLCRALTL